MAAIVAADVTTTGVKRQLLGAVNRGEAIPMIVSGRVVIDPGTTDTYPTGGIPLDVLFTPGGTYDLGLDPAQPITLLSGNPAKISDASTPACPVRFVEGASRTLMIFCFVKDDGTKSDTLIEYPAEDITTNTTVTTPLANGDKDIHWDFVFLGTKRAGYTGIQV